MAKAGAWRTTKAIDWRHSRKAVETSDRVIVENGSVRVARDALLLPPLLPFALAGCPCYSGVLKTQRRCRCQTVLVYIVVGCASDSAKDLAGNADTDE